MTEDCDRCMGERYIDDGDHPCPRCNPAVVRMDTETGPVYLVGGPVEVMVCGEAYDVLLHEAEPDMRIYDLPVVLVS
jgi:hypothetical protein